MENRTDIHAGMGVSDIDPSWPSAAYHVSSDQTLTNLTMNLSTILNNVTTQAPPEVAMERLSEVVRKISYHYLGPIICSLGMICNVINFAVLMQRQLKESPYTYLTGLALTDFGALTFSFVFMVISHKHPGVYFWRFYEAYIFIPLTNVCVTASVMIVVLLTIERFLFVRHPLWAKATCDRASAKVKILIILCISLIHNIPRFLCFKVSEHPKKPGFYYLDSTKFRRSDHYLGILWYYNISIHFLPLLILSAANAYLLYAVMQARIQRKTLQIRNNKEAAWHKEQVRLTITLISIIFLFIICIIPSAFADFPIAYFFFGKEKSETEFRSSDFYLILQYIANVLVWCNLSLNFVLYCAFNDKFRRIMCLTARRWLSKLNIRTRRNGAVLLLVNFKSADRSITRNNSSQTNSFSLQTKVSQAGQELLKNDKEDHQANNSTPLFVKSDNKD
ncbi:hypothetical protein FSP39_016589 [Pinctada imbricata]|uniref:G-protein coupled receptors family 1 profile domain-containing protein n=1 Tax=Pinctada imbricata TaxID=66713 RepID=A0AA88XRQ8_PINIB|nr:hypothetical protein FSP39_016589 [Pinctada imbricata]